MDLLNKPLPLAEMLARLKTQPVPKIGPFPVIVSDQVPEGTVCLLGQDAEHTVVVKVIGRVVTWRA